MKNSIIMTLSDQELIELQRILLDDDMKAALRFLKNHIEKRVSEVISGKGHCKPWFELPGGSYTAIMPRGGAKRSGKLCELT